MAHKLEVLLAVVAVLGSAAVAQAQTPSLAAASSAAEPSTATAARPAPAAASPAAPATDDIVQAFRTKVAAVVGIGAARRVLINNATAYGRSTRRLKLGDEFQDGWTIKVLDPQRVVLGRGAELREVDLTSEPASASSGSKSSFTFASLGLVPPPPPPETDDSATIDAAPAVDPALVQAVAQAIVQMQAPPTDAQPDAQAPSAQ